MWILVRVFFCARVYFFYVKINFSRGKINLQMHSLNTFLPFSLTIITALMRLEAALLTTYSLYLEPSEVGVIPPQYRTQFSRDSFVDPIRESKEAAAYKPDPRASHSPMLIEQWNKEEVCFFGINIDYVKYLVWVTKRKFHRKIIFLKVWFNCQYSSKSLTETLNPFSIIFIAVLVNQGGTRFVLSRRKNKSLRLYFFCLPQKSRTRSSTLASTNKLLSEPTHIASPN